MILKLIQVGLGGHGRGVGMNFVVPSADFEYAGLVDLDVKALEGFAAQTGVPDEQLYTDYKKAFRELSADAVLIVSISPTHYEICKAALENNLHVLVEKPFVLTLQEAEELVELAAMKKRNIMVDQNYRFFSTVLTLKKAIKERSLGKLRFVHSQFFCDHDGKAYQRAMDNYTLLEMAVHHVDMIRFLLDSNIARVSGATWNHPDSAYQGDPHVSAVYETDTGIPVFYVSSLMAKGIRQPWEGIWRFQFEQGSVHLDDLGEGYGVYVIDANQTLTKVSAYVPEYESIHGVLSEFAQSIKEQREPSTSGRDNLHTLAALLATSHSSREQKTVQVSRK